MTKQEHIDAYRADTAKLDAMLKAALADANPATALVAIAAETSELSASASEHLMVAQRD